MTDNATQLATLIERSAVATAADADAREADRAAPWPSWSTPCAITTRARRTTPTGSPSTAARSRTSSACAPDAAFDVELVAILHDIGKLAVPAAILDLARPLNSRERAVVRAHTIRGAEILAEIAGLAHLAPHVRASHERWDGTGYPDRLVGERIPLSSRLVFTVDAFDAMTNDRPYRRALGRAEARRRIAAGAGAAFDPRVVRALLAASR